MSLQTAKDNKEDAREEDYTTWYCYRRLRNWPETSGLSYQGLPVLMLDQAFSRASMERKNNAAIQQECGNGDTHAMTSSI